MIENALFEELQSNIPRARKIYELLDQEIAPGFVKSQIARIIFEKRQGNSDKANELYYQAFNKAFEREDSLAVAHIACIYARFLAFKCSDPASAFDVF